MSQIFPLQVGEALPKYAAYQATPEETDEQRRRRLMPTGADKTDAELRAEKARADLDVARAAGKPRAILRRFSDIQPTSLRWLWPGRIPAGKLTVLAGAPGLGKSLLTVDLAARVTTGRSFSDGAQCEKGDVIFISAEDDPADTIRPRLEVTGADLARCHFLDGATVATKDGRREVDFDLSAIETLRDACHQIAAAGGSVRLVVIDPWSAFFPTDGDARTENSNAGTRALARPLEALAAEQGFALVVVSHLRKSAAQDAMSRVIGSIGLVAAARAAWVVVRDKDNPARRLLVVAKANLAAEVTGLAFGLETASSGSAVVAWAPGVVTDQADDLLDAEGAAPAPLARELAQDFLSAFLGEGPKSAQDVAAAARARLIAEKTLRRAATELGVVHEKAGLDGGWSWRLPSKMATSPEGGQLSVHGHVDHLGHLREPIGVAFSRVSREETPEPPRRDRI